MKGQVEDMKYTLCNNDEGFIIDENSFQVGG